MKSRILQVGVLVGVLIGALIMIGGVLETLPIVSAGLAALAVTLVVLAADTNRRVRRLEKRVAQAARPVPAMVNAAPVHAVTEADVLGAVRLLQAQYTARLDMMHEAVERLAERVGSADHAPS